MTKQPEQDRISVIVPVDLMDKIMEDIEKENHRNVSEVVRAALYQKYKLGDPAVKAAAEMLHQTKPVKYHRNSITPEDLASVMKPGFQYTLHDLVNVSRLSRTTVRRVLIEGEGTLFNDVGTLRPKLYELKHQEKEKEPKKRKKRRGRKKKPSLDERIAQARKGLKIRQEQEEDDGVLETVYYVDLEDGEERFLGSLSDDEFMARNLVNDKTITMDDWLTYRLKYYYEHPEYWQHRIEEEELSDRLKNLDEVVQRVDQHMKNQ